MHLSRIQLMRPSRMQPAPAESAERTQGLLAMTLQRQLQMTQTFALRQRPLQMRQRPPPQLAEVASPLEARRLEAPAALRPRYHLPLMQRPQPLADVARPLEAPAAIRRRTPRRYYLQTRPLLEVARPLEARAAIRRPSQNPRRR